MKVEHRRHDISKEAHEVQFMGRNYGSRTRVGICIRIDAHIATDADGGVQGFRWCAVEGRRLVAGALTVTCQIARHTPKKSRSNNESYPLS